MYMYMYMYMVCSYTGFSVWGAKAFEGFLRGLYGLIKVFMGFVAL